MAKKSRTREARQRRQKQRRQNQRRLALFAIVLVAVVAVAVLFVSNQPVESYIPEELSKRFEGLERSFSPEGYPQLGDQDAPVTVEEFSSFACPGCQRFHNESLDEILERVLDGQVLFTYVPLQTGSIPNAQGASRAALCAGNQGYFWEMHDVLFDWQTRYGNTAFSQNRLLAGVEALGMNPNAFTSCFNSSEISATLNEALDEDVAVTPTVHVNGVTIESDTVLSAATILQTVDDVTPDDWGLDDESASAEPDEPAASADSADEPEATEDALVTAPPEPEPEEAAALEPVESAAEDEAGTEDESALDEIEIEAESDESAGESETSGG